MATDFIVRRNITMRQSGQASPERAQPLTKARLRIMKFASEGPKAIPLWIAGRAYLTVGDSLYDVLNPATGEVLRRVPMCGADEAATAVAAAQAAAEPWNDCGMAGRQALLAALADNLARYAGHFAKLLQQDLGWPETQALSEVEAAIAAWRNTAVGDSGVLALVVDASHPLLGLATAAAAPLLAGATLIIKPSPQAPSAAYALCELAARAAWPAGVLNLLHGDGPAIEGLCAAGVDRLIFSGNAQLAAQVGELAQRHGVACDMVLA